MCIDRSNGDIVYSFRIFIFICCIELHRKFSFKMLMFLWKNLDLFNLSALGRVNWSVTLFLHYENSCSTDVLEAGIIGHVLWSIDLINGNDAWYPFQ